jgi:hypothetical protein
MQVGSISSLMSIQVATVTLCTTTLFAKFQCAVTKLDRNNAYGKRGEADLVQSAQYHSDTNTE